LFLTELGFIRKLEIELWKSRTRGMHFVPDTYLKRFGVFDNKRIALFLLDKTEEMK